MIRLSIIVPIYNVKAYIRKCIGSLINQNVSETEYEIILVDDGDPQNSLQEIRHIERRNIHVLHKENGGLSSARNAGLNIAKGEYVWFVDSDDWIEENCLKELYELFDERPNVIYQTSLIPEEGRFVPRSIQCRNNYISTVDFFKSPHLPGAPFYLYKRDFLCEYNCRFKEGILHEDTLFTPCSLYNTTEIRLYRKPVYHVLCRDGSITSSFNSKRCYDLMIVINSLLDFYYNRVSPKDQIAFSSEITDCILLLLSLSPLADKQVRMEIDKYVTGIKETSTFLANSPRKATKILGYLGHLPFVSLPLLYRQLFFIKKKFGLARY